MSIICLWCKQRDESMWHLFYVLPRFNLSLEAEATWILGVSGICSSPCSMISPILQICSNFIALSVQSAVTDVIFCGAGGVVKICIYVKEPRTDPRLVTGHVFLQQSRTASPSTPRQPAIDGSHQIRWRKTPSR
jgi:hypothetical protein